MVFNPHQILQSLVKKIPRNEQAPPKEGFGRNCPFPPPPAQQNCLLNNSSLPLGNNPASSLRNVTISSGSRDINRAVACLAVPPRPGAEVGQQEEQDTDGPRGAAEGRLLMQKPAAVRGRRGGNQNNRRKRCRCSGCGPCRRNQCLGMEKPWEGEAENVWG